MFNLRLDCVVLDNIQQSMRELIVIKTLSSAVISVPCCCIMHALYTVVCLCNPAFVQGCQSPINVCVTIYYQLWGFSMTFCEQKRGKRAAVPRRRIWSDSTQVGLRTPSELLFLDCSYRFVWHVCGTFGLHCFLCRISFLQMLCVSVESSVVARAVIVNIRTRRTGAWLIRVRNWENCYAMLCIACLA